MKTKKGILHTIKYGITVAWKRHHFLIPPYALKRYFRTFKKLISQRKETSIIYLNSEEYTNIINKEINNKTYNKLNYNPLISVICPVYNTKKEYLEKCILSILNQKYDNYEIIIINDGSDNEETNEYLKSLNNFKIKLYSLNKNSGISEACNKGISLSNGEYIAIVDSDDELTLNALYENVYALNNDKTIDILYSNEDKINPDNLYESPFYKPDYSPHTFLQNNYICHLTLIRKSLIDNNKIKFLSKYDGAQDYDFYLKCSEHTNNIYHIKKILYHWRMSETSTSSNIKSKGDIPSKTVSLLNDALKRRKLTGYITQTENAINFTTHIINKEKPLVSIILLTKNHPKLISNILNDLYTKQNYTNIEVIVIDNGSKDTKTIGILNKYQNEYNNFKYYVKDEEFNYSKLNNFGVSKSNGNYLLFLNDDIRITEPTFIEEMLGYASLENTGVVGIKLLFPNKTIQHAGVVLGNGMAFHIHANKPHDYVDFAYRSININNYSAVTGACMMTSKKHYNEVNGLEERLKVAYNDVDLCLKMLEKGYYNVCLNHINLIHMESVTRGYDSTKKQCDRLSKETTYMHNRWHKELECDKYYPKELF